MGRLSNLVSRTMLAAILLFFSLAVAIAQLAPASAATQSSPHSSNSNGLHDIYPASTDHASPAWFVDVGDKAGIRVIDVNGGVKSKIYITETTGSDVAIFDYQGRRI